MNTQELPFDLANLLFGRLLYPDECTEALLDRAVRCTVFDGGQSGLIRDSGTGTIFEAAANGLPCRSIRNR